AYFKYVNARGGVGGRTIEYRYIDDAYNPPQSVQVTRQLVEQDKVFAVFNSLGTEPNLQVRDYLKAQGVPQLFVATGATTWGRDASTYPSAIGFQPSYQAEGWIYGRYLARTLPTAKVGVIYQNDDYGNDLLNGLKSGLQRSKVRIVGMESYELDATDMRSQVSKLKSGGADVLAIFATPRYAIQTYVGANQLGWRPKLTIVNTVASAANVMSLAAEGGKNKVVENSISIVFLKDPTDPQWGKDSGIRLYRQILSAYAKGANANDVYHVYGMAAAWTFVEALKKAGAEPTRAGIVSAVSSMNLSTNPFLLPGIAIKTGPGDHYPIEQVLLQRYLKGGWKSFGGLWGFRAG
ncbi:MAG: branched-chain amino acid ABC transporter substrate-binding protein, partial [Actinobacteria bacterium]|nr:branched-chain amino acid ABC transporter substrate-binding protein [Actinomycetota bacterium]